MTQKWYFCCFMTVLPIYLGEKCRMSHYSISTVCNPSYGTILTSHTGIRSVMGCASMCTHSVLCQSAVFDNGTGTCTTNSAIPDNLNVSCSEPVFYAASELYSVLCVNIFSTCVSNEECTPVSNAECRHGKCQCVPGLSHDPVTNACIPECFNGYGTTFQEDRGYYLDGFNDEVIENVFEPTLCMNYCVAETSFTCRSAELDLVWGVCFLSVDTVATQPLAHYPDSNYTLYQRDCAHA